MHTWCSHTKQHAGSGFVIVTCVTFSVLLVAADPNLQRLHVAHCNSCSLLGISVHSVEYSMRTQDENAATDSTAEACAVPCHSAWARLWNADADLQAAFRWSSPVLFVDMGFSQPSSARATLQSDLDVLQQKTCLLWDWKWYYLKKVRNQQT